MSLSCLRSSNPNITIVDQLYDDRYNEGSLYSGGGTPPLCSSTPPPAPSNCTVCLEKFVHAVCCELQENVRLVMEGAGQNIDLIKSDCPGLLGAASNGDGDSPGDHGDAGLWWLAILPLLLLLAVLLVVFCKRWKRQRSPKTLKGRTDAVDPSEEEPVNEAAV